MIKFFAVLAVGAGIGALMGYFGKCHNGQCPLTANPWRGALWGMFIAGMAAFPLLVNALRKPVPESKNIIHPESAEAFKSMISSKGKICLVDFYADWCGPCRSLAPVINQLADEYNGKINVIKVNVDKFQNLAREYDAGAIPTVIIIADGEIRERITGACNFNTYSELLEKEISKDGK